MGNECCSERGDSSPREAFRRYESYTSLWHEVIAKLSDEAAFTNECSKVYQEECARRSLRQLTKQLWQEMTRSFVNRVSCDDPRTKERIYRAVDGLFLGPGERAISEATFAEFTRLALTLAERDLRERIAKIQDKYGGAPPGGTSQPPPTISTQGSPLYGPSGVHQSWQADRSAGPPPWTYQQQQQQMQQQQQQSFGGQPQFEQQQQWPGHEGQQQHQGRHDVPTLGLPIPGRSQQPPAQGAPLWNSMPATPQERSAPVRMQLPLSAQRLQDLQRQQAEQEQRMQDMLNRSQPQRPQKAADDGGMMDDTTRVTSVPVPPPAQQQQQPPWAGGAGDVEATFGARGGMADPSNGHGQKALAAGGGQGLKHSDSGAVPGGLSADSIYEMQRNILKGNLRVYVFNKHLELQAKRLALNPGSRRISILRDDGLCEDSWEIDSLTCITQSIDASILGMQPPPGAAAFRFKFQDDQAEDRFLCVVFESEMHCKLATEAFGLLCSVPVTPA